MNSISEWLQDNWFDLGRLLAQSAIAVILAWYGRKALKILSRFEMHGEPEEASPGLSLLNATPRRHRAKSAPVEVPDAEAWGSSDDGQQSRVLGWLQAPMRTGAVGAWHRMVRWFQAPLGS